MSNFRQYMSEKQQMLSGPTRGNEARSNLLNQAQQNKADKKIAAETARREAREDDIRGQQDAKYASQRAEDKAESASYQNAYANQISTGSDRTPAPSPSPSPSPTPVPNSYQRPSGDRDSWSSKEIRDHKEHRGVADKFK